MKKDWSSESFGSKWQHHFFYLLIRAGGRHLAYFFLHFVVFYYMLFRYSIRKKASYYIKQRFPGSNIFQLFIHTYCLILEFGKILIDRAILGILGSEYLNVSLINPEILEKYKKQDKGFILMMSHVGGWQAALSALSFMEKPVSLLLQREEGDIDRHYFEHQGGVCPFNIINPEGYLGGVFDMIEDLKKGHVLCVMGDRVAGSDKNTLYAKFLNKDALFPYSTFKIASSLNVPVLVVFSYKTDVDTYQLEVACEIHVPENLPRSPDVFKPYVDQFVLHLEQFTQRYPYQFFNFFNMWESSR